MTDSAIVYARVALVLLAAVAVGYIWLGPYAGDRATATAAIIAALGSLLAFVQVQKATNQLERSLVNLRAQFLRSADVGSTIRRE